MKIGGKCRLFAMDTYDVTETYLQTSHLTSLRQKFEAKNKISNSSFQFLSSVIFSEPHN